ncbi:glycosyltransferase [Laspinema sp. D1]|uniref:glycosyltransferase n=1 Tax=Laspinema palackyanum TaxID=3231601 RepID=UPI00347349ED|nr:glycosyltransferase [Laspinema sp. D2b]
MKIVYIITGLSTHGGEMMLYKLLSHLNREQFEAVVISLQDRGTLGDRIAAVDIPLYTINLKRGKPTPRGIYRLICTVKQIKPDIIQGWMYHGNLAAQLASFFLPHKTPVVLNIQNSLYSLADEKRMTGAVIKISAHVSPQTAAAVFVSRVSQSQHEALGYASPLHCVIPNGIDIWSFKPDTEARSSVRSELGLSDNTLLIGMMARFHPQKDHTNFLQAAALLANERKNIHFLLAGKGVELKNPDLAKMVQVLGLEDKISLLGERGDMTRLNAALDIASLSSSYGEAFPLAVGEAMACAVPCAVTDVGDSGWMVGETGRVVEPHNPQALANAWNSLLNLTIQERKFLGQAARERVEKLFSLDSVVNQYQSLYQSLLETSKY